MTSILIRKILRDNWPFLLVVGLLLFAFEGLWARVTYQIDEDFRKLSVIVKEEANRLILEANKSGRPNKKNVQRLLKAVKKLVPASEFQKYESLFTEENIAQFAKIVSQPPPEFMAAVDSDEKSSLLSRGSPEEQEEFERLVKKFQERFLDQGAGKIVQALIGGDNVQLNQLSHILAIGYVHPLVQIMLCIWAIGRAAGTIAGEIDRGTMELLLGQPIPRWRIIFCHFVVDWLTIPALCLCMWGGALVGCWVMDWLSTRPMWDAQVYLIQMPAASLQVAALLFAVSGYTTWLSASGRIRNRVMGISVVITLLQFLVNVIGQIWADVSMFRPFTVFYYYNPQAIITSMEWYGNPMVWMNLAVLLALGIVGYVLAVWTFETRNIPAPL